MGLFRRNETGEDRHDRLLDLIEQVTELRSRVRTIESEWDDMRAQIRKGYQRMEKAYERGQAKSAPVAIEEEVAEAAPEGPTSGFVRKLHQYREKLG